MLEQPRFGSLSEIVNQIDDGTIDLHDVVTHYLNQIEAHRRTNAYVEVWAQEALERAVFLQKARENGLDQPLFGTVLSLKDNILYEGHTVTAASKILEGYSAIYTATAVQRLLDAGAILIGRTNCDQFGMGSSNENTIYGPVRNGQDHTRTSGGSSGGAAVSVQTDTCLAAIGSDTGGSVRQPAAFCGLMGLKPTYGRISRYGLIAYGSSFDQIGIIGRHSADISLLHNVMAGHDPLDATSSKRGVTASAFSDPKLPKKFAFIQEIFDSPGLDPSIRAAAMEYLAAQKVLGNEENDPIFPYLEYVIPTYYVLTTAEASSNLARYDGVRYGYRSPNAPTLDQMYMQTRTDGFSDEVKRRILLGTFVLSSGYYDAYYTKAQQARRLIRDAILRIFETNDFILLPAAPTVAWPIGEAEKDPISTYLADIYTVLANLCGIPAITFPVGNHPENGLPIGLQLMAAPWREQDLLDV
jgi:aspartyl-tRNA(Asn)/glutamyl-tRNA(Gln) amidotransferase subunit A